MQNKEKEKDLSVVALLQVLFTSIIKQTLKYASRKGKKNKHLI